MDFLKSAVTSAISKGSGFPYTIGDAVDIGTGAGQESVWELHNGTRRVRYSLSNISFFFSLIFKICDAGIKGKIELDTNKKDDN